MTDEQAAQSLHAWVEQAEDYVAYRLRKDPAHPLQAVVELVSPTMATLHGARDIQDVSTWFEAIHPDDVQRVLAAHLRADQTDEVFEERYRVQVGGALRWVHTISRPAFDDDGVVTHYNGLIVDITRQVASEQAEREAREALARVQRAATAGAMTMGVVHDLNNVLQIVQMACTLAAEQGDPVVQGMMKHVLSAVERGTAVGERLAVHYRPVSDAVAIDLAESVRQTCRLFALSRPAVQLEVDAPRRCITHAVVSTVENALLNLLANAADAMSDGGVIRVRLSVDDAVVLRVHDDGPGIPACHHDTVFQASFSTKGSTGLGLALSRDALEAMGGRLDLVPVPAGACFEIRVPVQAPPHPTDAQAPTPNRGVRVAVTAEATGGLVERLVVLLGHEVVPKDQAQVHIVDDQPHLAPVGPGLLLDARPLGGRHHPGFVTTLAKPFRIDDLAHAIERTHHAQPSGSVVSVE